MTLELVLLHRKSIYKCFSEISQYPLTVSVEMFPSYNFGEVAVIPN